MRELSGVYSSIAFQGGICHELIRVRSPLWKSFGLQRTLDGVDMKLGAARVTVVHGPERCPSQVIFSLAGLGALGLHSAAATVGLQLDETLCWTDTMYIEECRGCTVKIQHVSSMCKLLEDLSKGLWHVPQSPSCHSSDSMTRGAGRRLHSKKKLLTFTRRQGKAAVSPAKQVS